MQRFTPFALLACLCFVQVGCDSVEEERNETLDAIADGEDADEVAEEINETREQAAEEADYDIDAEDGLNDGDIDLDPGAGNDIGEEDGIGDADGAEPIVGSGD